MPALQLQLWLLLELTLYALLGHWLLALTPGQALLAGCGGLVALRVWQSLSTWLFAAYYASPAEPRPAFG